MARNLTFLELTKFRFNLKKLVPTDIITTAVHLTINRWAAALLTAVLLISCSLYQNTDREYLESNLPPQTQSSTSLISGETINPCAADIDDDQIAESYWIEEQAQWLLVYRSTPMAQSKMCFWTTKDQ